jgi:hypothetical protein
MIKVIPDVGAPIAVVAADLVTESVAEGKWNEWASYIVAAGGYLGGFMNWGGDFTKNLGIAALPWAAKNIYNRIRGGTSAPVTLRRVSRYPAPAGQTNFQGTKLI